MKKIIFLSIIAFCTLHLKSQVSISVCTGDTLALYMVAPPNSLIQWEQSLDSINYYSVPGAVSDTLYVQGAMTTRYYRALITGPECDPYYTETKKVIVLPLPQIFISGLDPSYCVSDTPVTVTATPAGGTLSGTGLTGNTFDPAAAGAGLHSITYSYTDTNGCYNSETVSVEVMDIPTIADAGPDIISSTLSVNMAANTPVSGTGEWAIISGTGGSFDSINSPTAEFTGTVNSVYTLTWTISNPPCVPSVDTITVTMPTGPSLPSVPCGTPSYTLYVHPTDNAGPTAWGCSGIVAGASDDDNGQANTTLIVSMCGVATAAAICYNLNAHGYSDWYLPAYNELECLRNNAATIGGFAAGAYWSSTEGSGILSANAKYRTFPSGVSGHGSKSSTHMIRCVRKD